MRSQIALPIPEEQPVTSTIICDGGSFSAMSRSRRGGDASHRNSQSTLAKRIIVAASELDTRLVMRALRNTERVLKNKGVDRLIEIEREKGASLKISDIHEEVAGVYPKVMIDGEMDAGAWSCGMMVGLIRDVPTVKELIDRIMADAERIIRDRLTGFLDGDSKAALKVA